MKKYIALILFWVAVWQPSFKMSAQVTPKNILDQKEKEKLILFEKVNLTQDSILKILQQQPNRKPATVKYIKVYRTVTDTLKVRNNVIVTPVAELPDDYYLIPDTTPEKKKKQTFFQRIFHHKKNN